MFLLGSPPAIHLSSESSRYDILGAGGTDNDLGSDGSNADLDTGVSILGEGALEEPVDFLNYCF